MTNTTKQTGKQIAIFHVRAFGQRDAVFPADYDQVATITVPRHVPTDTAADMAYSLTQNIEAAWITGDRATPAPTVAARGGCRSSSVGDVFEVDGIRFRVEPAGFAELPADPNRFGGPNFDRSSTPDGV